MRQIKFRGIDARTGEIVYGDLMRVKGNAVIYIDNSGTFEVEPSSIAQLVTVIDGVEIYEGDTFERDGKKYVATLEAAYHAAD